MWSSLLGAVHPLCVQGASEVIRSFFSVLLCMSTCIFWTTKKIYEAISLAKKSVIFLYCHWQLSPLCSQKTQISRSMFWYPRDQKPQHNDIICTRVRPLLTKSITSGIISCAGSCIAQVVTQPQGAWWQTDDEDDHLTSVIWMFVIHRPSSHPASRFSYHGERLIMIMTTSCQ